MLKHVHAKVQNILETKAKLQEELDAKNRSGSGGELGNGEGGGYYNNNNNNDLFSCRYGVSLYNTIHNITAVHKIDDILQCIQYK